MKRLVVDGGSIDEGADGCAGASTSDSEINIVTVTTEDIVTLATEALAATAVAQLTGEWNIKAVVTLADSGLNVYR